MNQRPALVTYPSCKQMLLSQLRTVLNLCVPDGSPLSQLDRHIRLHRAKICCQVLYISGVALQLKTAQKTPALEIATEIVNHLFALSESNLRANTGDDFTV